MCLILSSSFSLSFSLFLFLYLSLRVRPVIDGTKEAVREGEERESGEEVDDGANPREGEGKDDEHPGADNTQHTRCRQRHTSSFFLLIPSLSN